MLHVTAGAIRFIGFPWEIQLGVISIAPKQNVMDYASEWECEEEDELVIEKAELER